MTFSSSYREVRKTEGSRNRDSTVCICMFDQNFQIFCNTVAHTHVGSISAALSCRFSPKRDSWTREPQIMSVT